VTYLKEAHMDIEELGKSLLRFILALLLLIVGIKFGELGNPVLHALFLCLAVVLALGSTRRLFQMAHKSWESTDDS
jgi:hypothetical protein